MEKKNSINSLLMALLVFLSTIGYAQLVTDVSRTPDDLVKNVLLGQGIIVSNISYTGSNTAIGFFNGLNTNIGLDSGIVITTGTATNVSGGPHGPNNDGGSGVSNGLPGDPTLTGIIGTSTLNAAVLEFDFIPVSDTMNFRYVFGSEEYPEYVCSNFNDVFGFFISGPDPAGGSFNERNIALVPGTTIPVAINSVNNGTSGTFGAPGNCSSLSHFGFYINNSGGTSIQYDGFTTVMTAESQVVCGETYHIKIAIADANDGNFDSGVFLEAGSLKGGTALDVTTSITAQDTVCPNHPVEVSAIGVFKENSVFTWNFGEATVISGSDQGPFYLSWSTPGMKKIETTLTIGTGGCLTVSDSIFIDVLPCLLSIPNIYTPNADGVNDFFLIQYLKFFPGSKLEVFNRWGKKVVENINYQNDWDGRDLAEGVYFYILYPSTDYPDPTPLKGSVTLIR